jgi:hypothetical protein
MGSSEVTYISWLLMIFAALVGGWGISLLVRAATMRIERVRARVLEGANRPVRSRLRQRKIGSRGAMLIGTTCVLVGCGAWFAGITIEWWLGYMPLQMIRQDMWEVSAAGLVVISLTLTATGMLFDPSKGRPRCPTCWYDVESLLRMKEDGEVRLDAVPRVRADAPQAAGYISNTSAPRADRYRCMRAWPFVLHARDTTRDAAWMERARPHHRDDRGDAISARVAALTISHFCGRILGPRLHTLADRAHADETWQWQRTWLQNRLRSVWEIPRDFEDMLIARRVGFYGQSRMNAAQASVILEGLLSDEAVALASIQRDIPIFDAIDEEKSPAVLRGRLHDVIRAINQSSNSSTALILLAYGRPGGSFKMGRDSPTY